MLGAFVAFICVRRPNLIFFTLHYITLLHESKMARSQIRDHKSNALIITPSGHQHTVISVWWIYSHIKDIVYYKQCPKIGMSPSEK